MSLKNKEFNYAETKQLQILELPYSGNEAAAATVVVMEKLAISKPGSKKYSKQTILSCSSSRHEIPVIFYS